MLYLALRNLILSLWMLNHKVIYCISFTELMWCSCSLWQVKKFALKWIKFFSLNPSIYLFVCLFISSLGSLTYEFSLGTLYMGIMKWFLLCNSMQFLSCSELELLNCACKPPAILLLRYRQNFEHVWYLMQLKVCQKLHQFACQK